MQSKRKRAGGGTAVLAVLTALVVLGTAITGATASSSSTASRGLARQWTEQSLKGSVRLTGLVPLSVTNGVAASLGAHPAKAPLTLNFSFPLRDQAGLDRLIAKQAKTHRYLSRKQLYSRFAPPQAQITAVGRWLQSKGFRITHVGRDRMSIAARASTATVERALDVRIADFLRPATSVQGLEVRPYRFYSNTSAPALPARLGIQTVSGLSDVSRFFTTYQLAHPAQANRPGTRDPFVRGGGYFPSDLRGLIDIAGHGFDGTGQTIGMTLWSAPEKQSTLAAFATNTGDTPITVDPSCIATANSPTTPSSCSTQTVGADHLLQIMENGNVDPGTNFGSNVETALDIEAAHGVATHVGEKYYMSECHTSPNPGSGLANAGCNGTDVGMEEAMEDAANDPTLHSVSNSWGYGGEAEWGLADPFVISTNNILALAAAAGTSFYFSTGDAGTYQSGYPTDSPYVVSVGGTSTWSTSNTAQWSTSTTWSGGGSWCSNLFARPSWQVGAGVTAVAQCPGRISPDESAVADPNTGVRFISSTAAGTSSGQVGGTSLAAPVLNGMQAVVNNIVNAQTYPGAAPKIGFMAPLLYQLGNSGNADSYFRDIDCGNTANPTSGPDGDAAIRGFDPATGWGEPDAFNFAIGIAKQLGATGLSTPASLSRHFAWTCAKTPSNSSERAFSCPSASTCYAVGASSGGTPWYGKFLAAGAWGAVNTIFQSTNGGQSWFPSNSDMFSIACTNSSTCLEVGAGGRERRTTDGGNTWPDVTTAPGNNKPLTQVECPSSSVCYAVGDRGNAIKSTDGGQTWSWLSSTDGNPIYGLSCPTTSVCYATDVYAHVIKTTDGGTTWTWQTTPVTTPGLDQVAETGGPNPFAGLTGISCSDANTCAAVGFYATVSGQTPAGGNTPFVLTTTDGGTTWNRQASNTGTNYLAAVKCLPGTTTCFAVGRGGAVATTTDLVTWTAATSGTTSMLNSVYCSSATFCIAVGQGGTVDTFNGSAWTATTGNGGTGMLADVACDGGNLVCYATGKQGITLLTTTGGTSWTQQAGGGSQANQLNGIACTSTSTCYAAGAAGTILKTTNGGQSWVLATSGTTTALNAISCFQANGCTAVGAVASGAAVVRTTGDGTNWNAAGNTGTQTLNGVSCLPGGGCLAVGAAGTALSSTSGGSTWSPSPTGTANALNAVTCPSSNACYAVGAAGTILKFPNIASGPSLLTSGTTTTLNGVACVDDSNCIVDGNSLILGTTNAGASFSTQGNPLGGPSTAPNASGLALNGALCTSVRCLVGAGAQGDILMTVVAPTTSASVAPASPNGLNGWYVTAPTVTLTATAADKPVASTTYSIDGGSAQTYSGPFQVSTDGTHTVSFFSTDTDGNAEAAKSIQLKVDLNNPTSSAQISPAIQNGWYASPTVTLSGNDGAGSGIDHISYKIDGEATWHTYTGPLSGFTTGNHFVQFQATDVAGRVEPTVNLIAFKADAKKPTVNVSTPTTTADYQLHKAVNAKFKCTDRESGIASCVGSTANGSPLDTSTVGMHTFTVTGTDKAGNVTVVTRTYNVHYAWKGFISPVTNTSTGLLNLVHAGDLIQLKFGLGGNQGLSVLSGTPSSVAISCPAGTPHSVPAAPAGSTAGLSYNASNNQYRFGWQTDAAWAGTCRRFTLSLNDGSAPHTADFSFFS